MKHIFIINPAAGSGEAEKKVLPEISKIVQELGVEYELHTTLCAEETVEYSLRQAEKGEEARFYACGGDGTLNNVLNGIIGFQNVQLAYIPCGTGNDFARSFTEKEYFLDIKRQINGKPIYIDAIRFNNAYAINMFNIGVDCDVVVEVAKLKKLPFLKGSPSYAVGAVQVLSRGKTYRMRLEFDDGTVIGEELFLVAVGNGQYCGGGFNSAPYASLSDGLIDVCVIRPIKGVKIISLLAKYRKGTHVEHPSAAPYVLYKKCKKLSLTTAESMMVSTDGELMNFEALEFEIVPNAISFSVPNGSAPHMQI
ncbi:MAG: diacylglycerol kinase family lipid kinase [Clostridia bacterium]|nr:diacylglycerol kinase family lipid kinase [Clostridia bacterium]